MFLVLYSFNNSKAQAPPRKSIEFGKVNLQPFIEPETIHSYTKELADGRYTVAVKSKSHLYSTSLCYIHNLIVSPPTSPASYRMEKGGGGRLLAQR
jgi:hypothetical protein